MSYTYIRGQYPSKRAKKQKLKTILGGYTLKSLNGKKQLLLVDDDRSVAEMMTLLLETRGYGVQVARSGAEALEKVSETIDMVLLDLNLPDQQGLEVCSEIKSNQSTCQIPVIILSGNVQVEEKIEGFYLGADDFLVKPFDYEELIARIESIFRRLEGYRNGGKTFTVEERMLRELKQLIVQENVKPMFQPIYTLNPLKVFGFEALTRPINTEIFSNPEVLFKAAIKYGLYQDLEMLAWRKILDYVAQNLKDQKIFLNCNPYLIESAEFTNIKTLFEERGLDKRKVFFEITERSAISDFKIFYKHLNQYRDLGFNFAVDDVGGGYASLETIVETKPLVVKIDRHIVSGAAHDNIKRSIIKFIVSFCKENGVFSIGEGVEDKEDLDVLIELGVDAAQGYCLCHPVAEVDLKLVEKAEV